MSHQCPKCSAALNEDPARLGQCPACGVYFAKYRAWQEQMDRSLRIIPEDEAPPIAPRWHLLLPPGRADGIHLVGWSLLLLVMVLWGGWFIACDWRDGEIMNSFLHQPNLAFHEAGHVLFIPLGEFMSILGGSLFQCLVPLILMLAFLRRRDPAGGAACLWWTGQNVLDVAPYIADARALSLPLIGEYSEEMVDARILRHDWHNILERLDLLDWDTGLARLAWLAGSVLIVTSWCWLALILKQQWRARRLESRS